MKGKILIEGACDEIVDATGTTHNALTTPENAKKYIERTGVDMIVANLGTEHRATGKELMYHGDLARKIKKEIGQNAKVIATGGLSEIVASESDVIDVVDRTLTLRGLNMLYQLNTDKNQGDNL
jgi:pantothenate kinase type III